MFQKKSKKTPWGIPFRVRVKRELQRAKCHSRRIVLKITEKTEKFLLAKTVNKNRIMIEGAAIMGNV